MKVRACSPCAGRHVVDAVWWRLASWARWDCSCCCRSASCPLSVVTASRSLPLSPPALFLFPCLFGHAEPSIGVSRAANRTAERSESNQRCWTVVLCNSSSFRWQGLAYGWLPRPGVPAKVGVRAVGGGEVAHWPAKCATCSRNVHLHERRSLRLTCEKVPLT